MTIFDPARGRVIDGGGGGPAGALLRLIGLGVAAFILVIVLFNCVTRVGTGHVGVLKEWLRGTNQRLLHGREADKLIRGAVSRSLLFLERIP